MTLGYPSYLPLYESGELQRRADLAWESLSVCELCPHRCKVNRLAGEVGRCRSKAVPRVASWNLHPWEEPPISGTRGSGTLFFSGCTGRCRFCQNYPISQLDAGRDVSIERLAEMMVELQGRGAHNVNFVTPTHYAAAILKALPLAIGQGFCLPLLYNCSGYERVDTLRLLENVIDIWLPDSKYACDEVALELSGFPEYVEHNRATLSEMFRQMGSELVLDGDGIAQRGMVVRHLVLPDGLAGTRQVLEWIAGHLSPDLHVSVMDQYFPAYRCVDHPVLGRKITPKEYQGALDALDELGIENGWVQEHDQDDCQ